MEAFIEKQSTFLKILLKKFFYKDLFFAEIKAILS